MPLSARLRGRRFAFQVLEGQGPGWMEAAALVDSMLLLPQSSPRTWCPPHAAESAPM